MPIKLKKTPIIIIAILAVFIITYLVLVLRKPLIDDDVRAEMAADSSFIQLSQGNTEYTVSGPASGETLILVSGFSVPYFCWDPVVPALEEAGFQVIRYNHYGRGYSDSITGRYTPELFDTQLYDLIEALNIDTPVHLVGLSMGGAISIMFTNNHPELVEDLCLISPTGFPLKEAFTTKLVKTPLIGDFIYALVGDKVLLGRNVNNLWNFESFPEFQTQFEEQFQYRGITPALLSTLRNMPFTNIPEQFNILGGLEQDIRVIWGHEDQVVPFVHSELLQAAIPRAEIFGLENAGHVSTYDSPDQVIPLIIDFY